MAMTPAGTASSSGTMVWKTAGQMKKRPLHSRVLSLASALVLLSILSVNSSYAGPLKVSRVTDGDIIYVRNGRVETIIRLVGIDAPEISHKKREPSQPYAQAATKYLAGLVLNKIVEVKEYGQDRYGRTLGAVFLAGKNANLEMIKAGYAEVYRDTPAARFDSVPYWKAEEEARAAKKGMWAQGDKYVSPREWRRAYSGK
jgi:micrococcal nuclease